MRAARLLTLFGAPALGLLAGLAFATPAGAEEEIVLPKQNWSFSGPFGTFDRAAAQRGFQVYNEVCSNCHSLKLGYYRNLAGIDLSEEQIKAIAAAKSVPTIGDDGQPTERPALPSDHFRSPYPNDKAARAALNGALPPDLSVIEKARVGGPDYIFGVLTGYGEPPADMKMGDGMNYNKYFPGHQIAMPQPLQDDQVTYADGTKATIEQEARDVVTFLTYMANPEMEQRKRMGVKVIAFLVLLTGVTYAVKRKVWADVH
jgi:ubiquinol-cytochrome c reductase cytochrome c1 subunit